MSRFNGRLQLTKTTKPTGDTECPPDIKRAHEIEYLINEKIGTRDLDDSEIVDGDDFYEDNGGHDDAPISISSDDEAPAQPSVNKVAVKQEPGSMLQGPIARRVANTSRAPQASRTAPLDLLNTLTNSLDPDARSAREEERTVRSLQATQLLALSNQLRDAQAALEAARNQSHAAERRADNAELELRMERMTRGRQEYRSPYYQSPSPRHHTPTQHHSHRVRRETRYRSGGGSVMWVTPSDEEQERAQRGYSVDSDIEWQHYGTPVRHTPNRHPSRRRRSASPRSHTGPRPASRAHAQIDHDDTRPVSPFRAVSQEI